MNKAALVQAVLEALQEDFESRTRASRETRAVGNDAESKAENKYDTLSIEQNYLADGLARQAADALAAMKALENMPLPAFGPADPIDLGAVVELDFPDGREWFFLSPAAGGVEVDLEGRRVTVITPDSPLGSRLIGRQSGDSVPPQTRILAVA